jgi:hypothetical protein
MVLFLLMPIEGVVDVLNRFKCGFRQHIFMRAVGHGYSPLLFRLSLDDVCQLDQHIRLITNNPGIMSRLYDRHVP